MDVEDSVALEACWIALHLTEHAPHSLEGVCGVKSHSSGKHYLTQLNYVHHKDVIRLQ